MGFSLGIPIFLLPYLFYLNKFNRISFFTTILCMPIIFILITFSTFSVRLMMVTTSSDMDGVGYLILFFPSLIIGFIFGIIAFKESGVY